MGHPYPQGTGQDDKRARYDRMHETRGALTAVLCLSGGLSPNAAEAIADAIEDHAHAVSDRLKDGIEMPDGVTL